MRYFHYLDKLYDIINIEVIILERIIEKLLYGNLISFEHIGHDSENAHNARVTMRESRSALLDALTDSTKKLFYTYEDREDEYLILHEISLFSEGFRLGASILIDVLYGVDSE